MSSRPARSLTSLSMYIHCPCPLGAFMGGFMAAVERIVVQATALDKAAFAAKAKKLDMPLSELMRRGAFAYQSSDTDAELGALAEAAKAAADQAGAAIDAALDFIEASNHRIAAMEAAAAQPVKPAGRLPSRSAARKAA